jgi:arylsulfatase A-like enzyme
MFAALERRGILDNAVVVITADHGEEFMEHGLLGHDKTLFNEVIKVPLIMLVPGHTKRTDIRQVVPLTSVAPTLVELAGGSIPSSFAGHSLKDGLIPDSTRWWWPWAGAEVEGAAYTELIKPHQPDVKRSPPHQHAVVVGSRKLIVGLNGEREYYDLAADPSEKNPNALNEEQRADVDAVYDQFRALAQQRAAPREREELDAETKERMRALGYDH